MANLTPGSDAPSDPASASNREGHQRFKPGWRGKIAAVLMGAAGGMAINDFSTTLGYPGLAAVLAVAGVAAAAAWLRGLDARAWLPRRAAWLFLLPALLAAAIGAYASGPEAGILTAVAVILTAGDSRFETHWPRLSV